MENLLKFVYNFYQEEAHPEKFENGQHYPEETKESPREINFRK